MGAEYEHEASGRSLQGPCRRPFAESSETIRYRVIAARNIQLRRFFDEHVYSNAQMGPRLIRKFCGPIVNASWKTPSPNSVFSARAYDRILKRNRTTGCAAAAGFLRASAHDFV
jgi:predicted ATPase with chaperone activity